MAKAILQSTREAVLPSWRAAFVIYMPSAKRLGD